MQLSLLTKICAYDPFTHTFFRQENALNRLFYVYGKLVTDVTIFWIIYIVMP